LLSASGAVSLEDTQLIQEAENLRETCKDMHTIDESSLLQIDAEDASKTFVATQARANKDSYVKHYGQTMTQIDKDNKKILATQKKCMAFVAKYRDHHQVCKWCNHQPEPSSTWKWVEYEKAWYRWYDDRFHYWGATKKGFTHIGWTWYKGYWHHSGYVYKYSKSKWYRFQAGKWVYYAKRVPINPGVARGKKICRPFYILKKFGFPTSLARNKLPRCQVGQGKKAIIFMWTNTAACKFIGGKKVYHKRMTCKTGKPH